MPSGQYKKSATNDLGLTYINQMSLLEVVNFVLAVTLAVIIIVTIRHRKKVTIVSAIVMTIQNRYIRNSLGLKGIHNR